MEDKDNIVIVDDQGNNDVIFDSSERIFELRDQLSLDIISKNIIDSFNEPKNYEGLNYVTKFKESYLALKEQNKFACDEEILNSSLQDLCQLIIANLATKMFVKIGTDLDDENNFESLEEYLNKVEALYEFFVVRRYTNIKDYFKEKLLHNRIGFIEKYKQVLDDKTYDDLFLNQDKKKYKDISNPIILHFIQDIIYDIKSEVISGYEFFREVVNLDLFEEFNNKINEMIDNYGNELLIINDESAANAYLSILDDNEILVSLRNDLLDSCLQDAQLTDK